MGTRWWRLLGAGVLAASATLALAAPVARAELNGDNDCTGTGTWEKGTKAQGSFTVDAQSIGTQTVVIPRKDSVDWTGSVPEPPGEYSGAIEVDLPPPFSAVEIHHWGGNSQKTGNSGVEKYDLPALVPAGVTFKVEGHHTDQNGTCSGFVNLKIEGGTFGPATAISLGMTVITGGGLAAVGLPLLRRRRVV